METQPNLKTLGNLLYQRAMVRSEDEYITDPNGDSIRWMLDTRTPMLDSEFFGEVGKVIVRRLTKKEIYQVAGLGYGSFPLVCSVLTAHEDFPFRGGFVREERKAYGRHRLVEGPLDRSKPLVLMDDVLNSGKSALRALNLLKEDGFQVAGFFALFYFTWGKGKERLEAEGIWVDSLLDLNLRDKTSTENKTSETTSDTTHEKAKVKNA